jgi:hypothetical protein
MRFISEREGCQRHAEEFLGVAAELTEPLPILIGFYLQIA